MLKRHRAKENIDEGRTQEKGLWREGIEAK